MDQVFFSDKFMETEGKSFEHKGRLVSLAGEIPVTDGERVFVKIESVGSPILQGLYVVGRPKGTVEHNGVRAEKGKLMVFWADTMPAAGVEILMVKGCTSLRVWGTSDRDHKHKWGASQAGRAVIVETLEDGIRCYCNDCEPDDDFDDLVFSVRKLS